MLKNSFKIGKGIVKQLAIAFFFSFILLFGSYFILRHDIQFCIALANKVTFKIKTIENKEIHLDKARKRLVSYPSYGTIYGTIKIPDIEVEAPLYYGDTLDIIKNGIGHYAGSYFPGEGASIIFAAHNSREHFMYLPKLEVGAQIIVDTIYGTFTYQMTSSKIIRDTDSDSLPVQTEKEMLIMYTCYPVNTVGHKSKRYVVYAELVGDNT